MGDRKFRIDDIEDSSILRRGLPGKKNGQKFFYKLLQYIIFIMLKVFIISDLCNNVFIEWSDSSKQHCAFLLVLLINDKLIF